MVNVKRSVSTDGATDPTAFHRGEQDVTMHGEYKTPGGKLIAVDFAVADGALRDVVVSGDFFLYPEEALADLTGALEGMSVELPEVAIAERVRMALPRDAELLGSSPEAIGAAVRRALAAGAADAEAQP